MLDSTKVGHFIMEKRKALGMTQQQLAERLNVSFQAISKWENGAAYPNIEILKDLSTVLDVTVDEILRVVRSRLTDYHTAKQELILLTRIPSRQRWQKVWRQRTNEC